MYICHYCVDYNTESLSDMSKHFKRKNKCKCSTLYSFEDAIVLSKQRKYVLLLEKNILSKDDYIYI